MICRIVVLVFEKLPRQSYLPWRPALEQAHEPCPKLLSHPPFLTHMLTHCSIQIWETSNSTTCVLLYFQGTFLARWFDGSSKTSIPWLHILHRLPEYFRHAWFTCPYLQIAKHSRPELDLVFQHVPTCSNTATDIKS